MRLISRLIEATVLMRREALNGLAKLDVRREFAFTNAEDASGMPLWPSCGCLEEGDLECICVLSRLTDVMVMMSRVHLLSTFTLLLLLLSQSFMSGFLTCKSGNN